MGVRKGKVYLVGAGPGDAGLLTVKGARCLAEADVVVYDHLVNESLLVHVRPDAETVYAGKLPGRPTMTQDEINALLVERARVGQCVVRLKGGDPFVFGRGGEEAMHLSRARVAFEVVPGVSSAIAVPAYAGIPVTQRLISSSFHVASGHETPDPDEPSPEWDVLARTEDTVVLLMGALNLPSVVRELISRGRDPETPVALIRWGTLPEQETLVSTLGEVVGEAQRLNFGPPAVAVIGAVVDLRPLIRWAEARPLWGVRAAVTRPANQCGALIEALQRGGADVLVTPTIRVQHREMSPVIEREIEALGAYDWVVFTSANGVRAFMERVYECGYDARRLAWCQVAAIGERTAAVLAEHGVRPEVVARQTTQEGLLKAVRVARNERVLIPRAAAARTVLEEDLTRRGAQVRVLPVYDTMPDRQGVAALRRALTQGRVHLVTFSSASTVEHLARAVKAEDLPRLFAEVVVASIGPSTSAAIRAAGLEVHAEARTATVEALVEAIEKHYKARRGRRGDAGTQTGSARSKDGADDSE
jgi:uroporphyrinogen III methyltransferase/synthase